MWRTVCQTVISLTRLVSLVLAVNSPHALLLCWNPPNPDKFGNPSKNFVQIYQKCRDSVPARAGVKIRYITTSTGDLGVLQFQVDKKRSSVTCCCWCLIHCRELWRHDGQHFSRLRDLWSAAVPLLSTDVSSPWRIHSKLFVVFLYREYLRPSRW